MGLKLIKKTQEALAPVQTVTKNLVHVPEFKNEKGLLDLVADIHGQYTNAQNGGEESGWDGDANAYTLKDAMEKTDCPYLLTIGGSDVVFVFASRFDRDCVISDYLPDPEAW